MKEDEDEIPMHPKHHNRSMLWVMCAVLAFCGFGILIANNEGKENGLVTVGIIGAVGALLAFFSIILIRTVRASCPECKKRMKWVFSLNVEEVQWEVHQCNECKKQWRVPGVSIE